MLRFEMMVVPRGGEMAKTFVPVERDEGDHAPAVLRAEHDRCVRFRGRRPCPLDERFVCGNAGVDAIGREMCDLDRAPRPRRERDRGTARPVIDGRVALDILMRPRHYASTPGVARHSDGRSCVACASAARTPAASRSAP